jgi:hypothetical protein
MTVDSIVSILMKRDGLSKQEAEQMVREARKDLQMRLGNGEMPFDICEEHFGLEPDYIDQLM